MLELLIIARLSLPFPSKMEALRQLYKEMIHLLKVASPQSAIVYHQSLTMVSNHIRECDGNTDKFQRMIVAHITALEEVDLKININVIKSLFHYLDMGELGVQLWVRNYYAHHDFVFFQTIKSKLTTAELCTYYIFSNRLQE